MPDSIKSGVQSTFQLLFYEYALFYKDYTHMRYNGNTKIIDVLMKFENDYIFTHQMTKDWLYDNRYYSEMRKAIENPGTIISLGCGSAKEDLLNNKRKQLAEKPCVQYVQGKKNKCSSRGLCSALYYIDWKRNKMMRNKTKRKRLKRNKQTHEITRKKASVRLFELIIQLILKLEKEHIQATLLHKCVSLMQDNNWTCEMYEKKTPNETLTKNIFELQIRKCMII